MLYLEHILQLVAHFDSSVGTWFARGFLYLSLRLAVVQYQVPVITLSLCSLLSIFISVPLRSYHDLAEGTRREGRGDERSEVSESNPVLSRRDRATEEPSCRISPAIVLASAIPLSLLSSLSQFGSIQAPRRKERSTGSPGQFPKNEVSPNFPPPFLSSLSITFIKHFSLLTFIHRDIYHVVSTSLLLPELFKLSDS